jgi:DNA-binding transcriptional LysR family regulator
MEMHQVRYFLALSNTLNFTRAAEECNVTQPALTRSIKQLEEELGGELIRRERSHSHLTELGRRMLPLLQQCYEAANSARNLAKAVRGNEVAPLAVIISNSVNIELAMPAIAELFRAYSGIQLRIRRGSPQAVVEALKAGDVEVAIGGQLDEDWDRLDRWPLFTEDVELAVSREHRLGRDGVDEVDMRELSNEPLVHRVGCEFAEELSRCLASGGISAKTTHEVETDQDLLALLEAGGGIGLVSTTSPRSSATRRVRLRDLALSRAVAVYGVAGRHRSPAATTLLNLLRSTDWSPFGVSEPA